MTNQDFLIAALTDAFDDAGATREAVVHYNIHCPYFSGDKRSECDSKEISRDVCVECKEKWLKAEVET